MRVVQYAYEKSNVEPIVETTRLIEVTRSYEMLSQMMRRGDELRRTAVERLGEIPA
jgi:flagellar basal-body rod protein FlgF